MQTPTIKGIFVKSHLHAVEEKMGSAGVAELWRRFGKELAIKNNDNIPIADEVKIINLAYAIVFPEAPAATNDFEAGRFHFRNFLKTPLAKFIFTAFRGRFKMVMMNAKNIAGHVFKGMTFVTTEIGPTAVNVEVGNSDYPAGHFQGLLYEWLKYSKLNGTVQETLVGPRQFEYIIRWKE